MGNQDTDGKKGRADGKKCTPAGKSSLWLGQSIPPVELAYTLGVEKATCFFDSVHFHFV